jgi:glycerophosphoryl diester phosphodiesterase
MIEILSHRGWWRQPNEKNTAAALRLALQAGYGVETDVRDFGGRLVISHDPPSGSEPAWESFLSDYAELGARGTLAINVKADGLQELVAASLREAGVSNYFVFDMSLPELVRYRSRGMAYFTRLSDHEPHPLCLEGAAGVWVDGFERDWTDLDTLTPMLEGGRRLALVSPELHRRDKTEFWVEMREWLRRIPEGQQASVMLCTDHPGEAETYFYE